MSILYTPFGFIFRIFYDLVSNYGLALFLFTLLFRLILLPSSISQQKGTAKQMRLQPKIKKLQEKYKGNQVKLNEEMQALYSREGYNPMSAGCLPMLIQLPVIFGLLGVIYYPIQYVLGVDSNTVGEMNPVACAAVFRPVGDGVRYLYLDSSEADQSRNGEKPDDGLHGLWHAAVFPCDRVPVSCGRGYLLDYVQYHCICADDPAQLYT